MDTTSPSTRSHVRHAGDDPEFYERVNRERAEREQAARDRIAAREAEHGPARTSRKPRR